MVMTSPSCTDAMGVTHERRGWPFRCTVHAPHCAMPQPYFVPVSFSSSRRTHSKGVSASTSTLTFLPLTEKFVTRTPKEAAICETPFLLLVWRYFHRVTDAAVLM